MERVYFSVDDVAITFYERLGDALDAAGLTKKQLRERINADSRGPSVSAGSVSNWFNGVGALPNGENIKALCKALNVTPDYLLGYTKVPNYNSNDAETLKSAESYTHLPPQALTTLHYDTVGPFLPPSAADISALDGFGSLNEHRVADELASLLAQADFLRALKTVDDLRQTRKSLEQLNISTEANDTSEAQFILERDYEYLRFKVIDALTKSLDAILEQG